MQRLLIIYVFFCAACHSQPERMWNAADVAPYVNRGITYIGASPAEGTIYTLGENGDTLTMAEYADGKLDGCARKWYANGQLQEVRWYAYGKKDGEQVLYWPDGQCRSRFTCSNDLLEGVFTEYFADGSVYKQMHYKHGHESGLQTMYAANGMIRSNYIIQNGRRYGLLGTKHCGDPFAADTVVAGL